MLKKLLNKYQVIFLISLTLILQVVILLINSISASKFGIETALDSFNLSKNISTFVFGLVGAAITTVIIPTLSKGDKLEEKSINTFISFIYLVLTLILTIIFIFKNNLIYLIIGKNTNISIDLTQSILGIILFSYYILAYSNILIAFYQMKDRFIFIKMAQLLSNIIVLFLIYYFDDISIYYYSCIIALGNILNVIILLLNSKKIEYKYRFVLDFKDVKFRIMLKNLFPILCATGLYQLSLIIDTILSTRLGDGILSLLSYSISIIGMINVLFISNLIAYIYPKLAFNLVKSDKSAEKLLYEYSLFLIALIILLVVGFLLLGKDIIFNLFQRGKFTTKDTYSVYLVTCIYIFSLPFNAVRDMIYRYFYSNNNTKIPFLNSLKATVINIILSVILTHYIGLNGIVIGTVLSSVFSSLLIQFKLNEIFKINIIKNILESLIKIIISGIVSYFIGKILINKLNFVHNLLRISISGLLITTVYLIILRFLKFKILINYKESVN